MKIVIVGDGKVGAALTAQLSREGHDIVVIDSNHRVLEQSAESYDVMVVHGNGASLAVLQEADIESADLLIAATSSDELNLLTCMLAKKVAGVQTIARVRSPEYVGQLVYLREELGLSMTINPDLAAAREAYHLLQFPAFLKRDSFAKGKVEIVELGVAAGSKLDGVPLSLLYEIAKVKVLVCAVERDEGVVIPDGSFRLRGGDRIYVTADTNDLAKLIKHLGIQKHKVRNVMIIGGSRLGFYLAQQLLRSGVGVKIIEQNPQRCEELAQLLPKAVVIEADGSRQDVLLSEGIHSIDAVVTLTNMDEENLIIAMFASHIGVPKVITKINRLEYGAFSQHLGLESILTPKLLCSMEVVRYVRAMGNTTADAMVSLHKIANDKAEAVEFVVQKQTRHLGTPLSALDLKPGILIACITHRGRTIIPSGGDCFQAGDTVIVVTTSEQTISEFNDVFAR